MARWWNRLQSQIYSRVRWLPELYARASGGTEPDVPLPPLAAPTTPLAEARVAVLTAAGVHVRTDPGFDMTNPAGDASYRVIPGDVAASDLAITHDYYDHRAADRDINCVFPIERLREMVGRGELGALAPRHVGMMGHLRGAERRRLVQRTAPDIAALFREDGVAVVLATPG